MSSWCTGTLEPPGIVSCHHSQPPVCCSSFAVCTQEWLLVAGGEHPSPSPPWTVVGSAQLMAGTRS